MTKDTKWPWIKQVNPYIFDVDKAPFLGNSPDFPWQVLGEELQKLFEVDSFALEPEKIEWLAAEEIEKKLPKPWYSSFISASGINGSIEMAIRATDVELLMSAILQLPLEEVEMQDKKLVEGFMLFLIASTLEKFSTLPLGKTVSFVMNEQESKNEPHSPRLTQTFWISILDKEKKATRLYATLLIDNEFYAAWHAHFTMQNQMNTDPLASLSLPISVEAGRSHISYEQLKQCHPGDCLLIDEIFFFPNSAHKEVRLSLNGTIFARAAIENNKIKMLELPS